MEDPVLQASQKECQRPPKRSPETSLQEQILALGNSREKTWSEKPVFCYHNLFPLYPFQQHGNLTLFSIECRNHHKYG